MFIKVLWYSLYQSLEVTLADPARISVYTIFSLLFNTMQTHQTVTCISNKWSK